jgi:hypothetical protein
MAVSTCGPLLSMTHSARCAMAPSLPIATAVSSPSNTGTSQGAEAPACCRIPSALSASDAGHHTDMVGNEESASCTLALSTTCSNRTSLSPEKVKM